MKRVHFRQLSTIDVNGCNHVTDKGLQALARYRGGRGEGEGQGDNLALADVVLYVRSTSEERVQLMQLSILSRDTVPI